LSRPLLFHQLGFLSLEALTALLLTKRESEANLGPL
jgi:hypothetical protein